MRQGDLRGSFALRPGRAPNDGKTGVYRLQDGSALGIVATQFGRALIDYSSGEIRGLYGEGAAATWSARRWRGGALPPANCATRRRDSRGAARCHAHRRPASRGSFRLAGSNPVWNADTAARARAVPRRSARPRLGADAAREPDGVRRIPRCTRDRDAGLRQVRDRLVERRISWRGRVTAEHRPARPRRRGGRKVPRRPAGDRPEQSRLVGVGQAGWIMPLAATREPHDPVPRAAGGADRDAGRIRQLGTRHRPGGGERAHLRRGRGRRARNGSRAESTRCPGSAAPDPVLWVWGENDRHVPTALCVEQLEPLLRAPDTDLAYVVRRGANHSLLDSAHGLGQARWRRRPRPPGLFGGARRLAARPGLGS